jgi:hypothetical protein
VKETITIERLPEESSKAYAARVEYVTAGPQRSLDRLRQNYGKTTAYTRQLEVWSARYDWAATARAWDDQQAAAAIQAAAEQYRADLEAHRKKAMDAGQGLYSVAGQLLKKLNSALASPRQIKGEDGLFYTLHGIDFNAAVLTTVSRALQTALDLEAHALGVDKLLPSLEADDSE